MGDFQHLDCGHKGRYMDVGHHYIDSVISSWDMVLFQKIIFAAMCIVSDDRHRCRCDDCSSATPSHDRCDYLTQIRRVLYGYLAIGRIDRICSRCTVGMTTTSQIFCSFPYVVYCYYSRRINSTRCQNTCSWSICTSGIWSCGRSSGWTCTAAVLPHRSGWMDEIVVTFCMTQQLWFSTGRHHTFSFAYVTHQTTKIL